MAKQRAELCEERWGVSELTETALQAEHLSSTMHRAGETQKQKRRKPRKVRALGAEKVLVPSMAAIGAHDDGELVDDDALQLDWSGAPATLCRETVKWSRHWGVLCSFDELLGLRWMNSGWFRGWWADGGWEQRRLLPTTVIKHKIHVFCIHVRLHIFI